MKIAFFSDNYHPQISGVTENIETSAKALRQLGHQVFIVAPKTPGYKSKEKDVFWIPSVKINKNPEYRFIIPWPNSVVRKLLAQKFDVIHGHNGVTCLLAWEIARRKKIPYIYTYHTLLNRYTHYLFKGKIVTPKMAEIASRVFCNLSQEVIVPTPAVKRELIKYGVKKPINVIPGGISLEKFKEEKPGFLRGRYNIPEEKTILLYVGRIGKEKNIDFILRSYSEILKKTDRTILVIVGDGPEKEKLVKKSQALGIYEKTIFTGFIDMRDVAKVYADGDIFLFSSTSETQGLVVLEAMSQKLPVVVIQDGAFEDVVINEKTGFATKNSLKDYTKAVLKLVDDEKLRKKMGEEAATLVKENYSSTFQAEKLVEIYQKSIGENLTAKSQSRDVLRRSLLRLNMYLNINKRFNQFKKVVRSTVQNPF